MCIYVRNVCQNHYQHDFHTYLRCILILKLCLEYGAIMLVSIVAPTVEAQADFPEVRIPYYGGFRSNILVAAKTLLIMTTMMIIRIFLFLF